MEETLSFVMSHWPFVVFAGMASLFVQVFKGSVWTRFRAEGKGKARWFFWWMRKTLPLHPVVVGALVGIIPGIPASEGVTTMAARCLYYAGAGLVSTWLFSVVRGLLKKRGIDIPPVDSLLDGDQTKPDAPIPIQPGKPPQMDAPSKGDPKAG